ncbi:hypothetical protein SNEBB_008594 [Seison nebaliae]|nr:hypothetical protein SNEBB_008594 [Seison nebaliae]
MSSNEMYELNFMCDKSDDHSKLLWSTQRGIVVVEEVEEIIKFVSFQFSDEKELTKNLLLELSTRDVRWKMKTHENNENCYLLIRLSENESKLFLLSNENLGEMILLKIYDSINFDSIEIFHQNQTDPKYGMILCERNGNRINLKYFNENFIEISFFLSEEFREKQIIHIHFISDDYLLFTFEHCLIIFDYLTMDYSILLKCECRQITLIQIDESLMNIIIMRNDQKFILYSLNFVQFTNIYQFQIIESERELIDYNQSIIDHFHPSLDRNEFNLKFFYFIGQEKSLMVDKISIKLSSDFQQTKTTEIYHLPICAKNKNELIIYLENEVKCLNRFQISSYNYRDDQFLFNISIDGIEYSMQHVTVSIEGYLLNFNEKIVPNLLKMANDNEILETFSSKLMNDKNLYGQKNFKDLIKFIDKLLKKNYKWKLSTNDWKMSYYWKENVPVSLPSYLSQIDEFLISFYFWEIISKTEIYCENLEDFHSGNFDVEELLKVVKDCENVSIKFNLWKFLILSEGGKIVKRNLVKIYFDEFFSISSNSMEIVRNFCDSFSNDTNINYKFLVDLEKFIIYFCWRYDDGPSLKLVGEILVHFGKSILRIWDMINKLYMDDMMINLDEFNELTNKRLKDIKNNYKNLICSCSTTMKESNFHKTGRKYQSELIENHNLTKEILKCFSFIIPKNLVVFDKISNFSSNHIHRHSDEIRNRIHNLLTKEIFNKSNFHLILKQINDSEYLENRSIFFDRKKWKIVYCVMVIRFNLTKFDNDSLIIDFLRSHRNKFKEEEIIWILSQLSTPLVASYEQLTHLSKLEHIQFDNLINDQVVIQFTKQLNKLQQILEINIDHYQI